MSQPFSLIQSPSYYMQPDRDNHKQQGNNITGSIYKTQFPNSFSHPISTYGINIETNIQRGLDFTTPRFSGDPYQPYNNSQYSTDGEQIFAEKLSARPIDNNSLTFRPPYFTDPSPREGQSGINYQNRAPSSNLASGTDRSWTLIPQPMSHINLDPQNDSKYFGKGLGARGKTYDLFPIQETIEPGLETPREPKKPKFSFANSPLENRNNKNNSSYSQSSGNRDKGQESSYYGSKRSSPLSERRNEDYLQSSWGSPREDSYYEGNINRKEFTEETSYSSPKDQQTFKENLKAYNLKISNPYEIDQTIDNLIMKRIGGKSNDATPSQLDRKINLLNQDIGPPRLNLGNLSKSPLNHNGSTLEKEAQESDRSSYSRNKNLEFDFQRPSIMNRNSSLSSLNVFDPTPLSSERNRLTEGESVPNPIILEPLGRNIAIEEPRFASKNNNLINNLTSPQGGQSGNQSKNGVFGQTENKFTSPLLQKYSNPFMSDYLSGIKSPTQFSLQNNHSGQEKQAHNGNNDVIASAQARPVNHEEKVKSNTPSLPKEEYKAQGNNHPILQEEGLVNKEIVLKYSSPIKPKIPYFKAQDLQDDSESLEKNQESIVQKIESWPDPKLNDLNRFYHSQALEDDHNINSPKSKREQNKDDQSVTQKENPKAEKNGEATPIPSQEVSPDRKMKKLTFKARQPEERTPEKRNAVGREENSARTTPELRNRKKIFETKQPETQMGLLKETLANESFKKVLKEEEKPKKKIFNELKEKAGPEIEVLSLLEEEDSHHRASPIVSKQLNTPSSSAKLGDLVKPKKRILNEQSPAMRKGDPDDHVSKEIEDNVFEEQVDHNDDNLSLQLNNAAMDISQSFFDFENEVMFTEHSMIVKEQEELLSERVTKTIPFPNSSPNRLSSGNSSYLPAEKINSSTIWVLDNLETVYLIRKIFNCEGKKWV